MFGKLLKKEIKGSILGSATFITILILVWHLFLRTRAGGWPGELVLGLGILPMFIPFIWAIAMGFYTLYTEWKTNTVYLLLSIPVKGWKIIGAKLTANLLGLLGIVFIGTISFFSNFSSMFFGNTPLPTLDTIIKLLLLGGMNILPVLLMIITHSQLSFILGRLLPKFQGLATGASFFIGFWLIGRLIDLLNPLIKAAPSVKIGIRLIINGSPRMDYFQFNIGLPIAFTLLSIVLFTISGRLFENRVEL